MSGYRDAHQDPLRLDCLRSGSGLDDGNPSFALQTSSAKASLRRRPITMALIGLL